MAKRWIKKELQFLEANMNKFPTVREYVEYHREHYDRTANSVRYMLTKIKKQDATRRNVGGGKVKRSVEQRKIIYMWAARWYTFCFSIDDIVEKVNSELKDKKAHVDYFYIKGTVLPQIKKAIKEQNLNLDGTIAVEIEDHLNRYNSMITVVTQQMYEVLSGKNLEVEFEGKDIAVTKDQLDKDIKDFIADYGAGKIKIKSTKNILPYIKQLQELVKDYVRLTGYEPARKSISAKTDDIEALQGPTSGHWQGIKSEHIKTTTNKKGETIEEVDYSITID